MYKLLIKFNNQQKQIFEFAKDVVIGRGDDCDLQFLDPSVSRNHAKIYLLGDEIILEDLGSQNGVVIDGSKLAANQRIPLASKSEIQIGKFTLIFLTNSMEDGFYRGRSINYLPKFNPSTITMAQKDLDEETLHLSAREATKILREQNLVNNACIQDSTGKFYYPEGNDLSFGKAGIVKVSGFMVGKIAAIISWNGKQHVLKSKGGWFTSVKVNDINIQEHPLSINDTIQIGNSTFKYLLKSE